jgi:hypothetical protein
MYLLPQCRRTLLVRILAFQQKDLDCCFCFISTVTNAEREREREREKKFIDNQIDG